MKYWESAKTRKVQVMTVLARHSCVPIAKLVNMSLEQGVVPDAMKLAKVMPIHKAKLKPLFTNYRPISLLSNMSKILERVIHNRMMELLVKHDILYNKQFAFRSIHLDTPQPMRFTHSPVMHCVV